jgi:hypothetical protein
LHQADDAFRGDDDEADQQQADNQQIDRGRDGHGCDLLDDAEQQRADQRADPARGAANHRHGDGVHCIGEAERRARLEVADVVGERRAGHAHQRAGDRGRDKLELERRHAAGFGCKLVVANGGEAVAQPRLLDDACDRDGDNREHQHDQEQILDVVADERHLGRADDVGAARAANEVPVHYQRLQHDRQRERGDGEE